MRILITGTTYAPALNGQSIFTTNLAEGLARLGHRVCMVVPSDFGKPYQIERNGVLVYNVRSIDLSMIHNPAAVSFLPDIEVKRIFQDFSPDIVHVHDHYPLSKCVLKYARLYGLPVVGTNHFVPENLAPYVPLLPRLSTIFNRLLWWWMKRVYNHLDLVTAPSRTAVEILRSQRLKEPVKAVSCGVNFDHFRVIPEASRRQIFRRFGLAFSPITFLFVGRVDAEKKVDVLIRALKQLNRRDIQLVIAGKGAALSGYQRLAQELGVGGQVQFTGFVVEPELPLLLNCVDVFAMPSEAELLSIASLEAMASGKPILAARSKALPELVDDAVNGYLFEPGNVADAARCMALLADHPERLPEMGAASLDKVKFHGVETVLKSYEDLYRDCIEKTRNVRGATRQILPEVYR
jgi:glycosyltransferase involved in cell wall biosynthesis